MTETQALKRAEQQLVRFGPNIGERQTPVVSYWPLSLKKSWPQSAIVNDGDSDWRGSLHVPRKIQTYYIPMGETRMMQLAWFYN